MKTFVQATSHANFPGHDIGTGQIEKQKRFKRIWALSNGKVNAGGENFLLLFVMLHRCCFIRNGEFTSSDLHELKKEKLGKTEMSSVFAGVFYSGIFPSRHPWHY